MPVLTAKAKTGPGGTEFVVRAERRRGAMESTRELADLHAPVSTAYALRQAVESARREGRRDKVLPAAHRRLQFWTDACREVLVMQAPCSQVLELHQRHGCRFCVPAPRQIEYILDALDAALPAWDREHPELFFTTLELNYPELLRRCRVPRRN